MLDLSDNGLNSHDKKGFDKLLWTHLNQMKNKKHQTGNFSKEQCRELEVI